MGVTIYDIGLDVGRIGERSIFYAMESAAIMNYGNVICFIFV